MDWKQQLHGKEAAHWKKKYERTVKLCKVIWIQRHMISTIQHLMEDDEEEMAMEFWDSLEYETQKLLITAPRFGGPFTTQERAKIKELWEITSDDIENRN